MLNKHVGQSHGNHSQMAGWFGLRPYCLSTLEGALKWHGHMALPQTRVIPVAGLASMWTDPTRKCGKQEERVRLPQFFCYYRIASCG